MPVFDGVHDHSHPAPLPPPVRVSWSRERAWHKEEVIIAVRTAFVPDGAPLELAICATNGGQVTEIDKLTGLAIRGNMLDRNYVIDWKDKNIPAGSRDFIVRAHLTDPDVTSPDSDVLMVDLVPPALSY
ncbi:MAG: hypothetical protein HY822_07910 [Acidobacteria bacterium]|nr:hypothetical protein [Acidobacteriota bacterium]